MSSKKYIRRGQYAKWRAHLKRNLRDGRPTYYFNRSVGWKRRIDKYR